MPALGAKYENVALALAGGDTQKNAAIAGGFSHKPASVYRLCRNHGIPARVAEIKAEREEMNAKARQVAAEESGVDLAWIERHAKHVVLKAIRGEPLRRPDGSKKTDPQTGEVIYKPDLQAANFGLQTLGRMKGAFIDRTEIGGPGDFARMADSDLDQALIELARQLGLPASGLKMIENLTKKEAAE
jgi:hypothetical protein